jgi:Xaa-Pro aminopeptidase
MSSPFEIRRARLLESLSDAVLLLPSSPVALRNNDVEHEYRQSSDLYYLSGFTEPHSLGVLRGGESPNFLLFVKPRDPEREIWDGRRAGLSGACSRFGADKAHSIDDLAAELPKLLENRRRVYHRLGVDPAFDAQLIAALGAVRARERRGVRAPVELVDLTELVHELRVHKDASEVLSMRHAVGITGQAHAQVMARATPGATESELEAELLHVFRRAGAERAAYPSIVGSGPNTTILHYRENNRTLEDGDLVLVDAGCEWQYTASDITRTFPANGRFSGPQRALYELVLEAQLEAIAAVKPGVTQLDVHQAAVRTISQGLVDLGLLRESLERVLEEQLYQAFFMHKTSHYLGMDVHDVGAYFSEGKPRPLEPGMVITVEPGVYVSAEEELVPQKYRELFALVASQYRGIGIRIEDDVLVTEAGAEVLSAAIVKSVADVEHACSA